MHGLAASCAVALTALFSPARAVAADDTSGVPDDAGTQDVVYEQVTALSQLDDNMEIILVNVANKRAVGTASRGGYEYQRAAVKVTTAVSDAGATRITNPADGVMRLRISRPVGVAGWNDTMLEVINGDGGWLAAYSNPDTDSGKKIRGLYVTADSTLPQAHAAIGISGSTAYVKFSAGDYPIPVYVKGTSVYFDCYGSYDNTTSVTLFRRIDPAPVIPDPEPGPDPEPEPAVAPDAPELAGLSGEIAESDGTIRFNPASGAKIYLTAEDGVSIYYRTESVPQEEENPGDIPVPRSNRGLYAAQPSGDGTAADAGTPPEGYSLYDPSQGIRLLDGMTALYVVASRDGVQSAERRWSLVSDIMVGIGRISDAGEMTRTSAKAEYYTLDGKRMTTPPSGIFIERIPGIPARIRIRN